MEEGQAINLITKHFPISLQVQNCTEKKFIPIWEKLREVESKPYNRRFGTKLGHRNEQFEKFENRNEWLQNIENQNERFDGEKEKKRDSKRDLNRIRTKRSKNYTSMAMR